MVEIKLNAERSLNALTLDMIDAILPQVDAWEADERVVAILLDSAGEKAFCAGGDVVTLYKAINGEADRAFPSAFLKDLRLDYRLHTYRKPIICWGSGIVMGGGMGLLSASSHRVVTENLPAGHAGSDDWPVSGCGCQLVFKPSAERHGAFSGHDRRADQCIRCSLPGPCRPWHCQPSTGRIASATDQCHWGSGERPMPMAWSIKRCASLSKPLKQSLPRWKPPYDTSRH